MLWSCGCDTRTGCAAPWTVPPRINNAAVRITRFIPVLTNAPVAASAVRDDGGKLRRKCQVKKDDAPANAFVNQSRSTRIYRPGPPDLFPIECCDMSKWRSKIN